MAITLSSSFIPTTDSQLRSFSGCSLKPLEQQCNVALSPRVLLPQPIHQRRLDVTPYKRGLSVRAAYSEGGKPISAGIFIGGFVLGGIIVGTLGCVYAPQISRALAGTDKKDLMRKLPKFIYDEEKALEKTRKILSEKIAQLNSAIDDASSQLRAEDSPNEETVESDSPNEETVESDVVEAAI